MSKNWMYRLGLTLIAGLFMACDDEKQPFSSWEADLSIKELVKQGWLLKQVDQTDKACIFRFEEGEVEIPADDVAEVNINATQWSTTVTYSNGEIIKIPTKGNSIDEMVSTISVNPSGYNPLAAQVRMNLPQGGVIQTIVNTKKGNKSAPIEHTNAFSFQTVQFIDIVGLYSDYVNKVDLIYTDKNGNERGRKSIEIPIKALGMNNLHTFKVVTAQVDQMEPGLNLVNSPGRNEDDTSCPYMVDADGEIRWILDWQNSKELLHIGAQCGLYRLPNGNFITGDANNNQLVEVNLLGAIIHRWDLKALGYSFHHAVIASTNGNYIVSVTKQGALHADGKTPRVLDFIIEIDSQTGKVVKEGDLSKMLDTNRINAGDSSLPEGNMYGQNKSNWLHHNGVTETNNGMISTGRWQGVFKHTRNNELKWVLSPHKDWRSEYRKFLLQPLDKNGQAITDPDVLNGITSHPDFEWAWGLHCPILMPNGHLLVFDNGFCRNFTPLPLSDNRVYSRIVEYEVDEKNMTVRQVWQYGKERGRDCYAPAMSGIQYLAKTGNRLFCPGIGNRLNNEQTGGRIIEINPQNGQVVFELEVEAGTCSSAFHRADRISLYPTN